MSWHLPRTPLLSRVVAALMSGLGLTVAGAILIGFWLPVAQTYAVTAAAIFTAIALMVVRAVGAHHPFDRFGVANSVTTLRAALVALTAALLWEGRGDGLAWAAATLGVIVIALDGVDGWLARRTSMASPFGARFDMELDALIILVLGLLAWRHGKAGAWILLAGAMRYLFVAAGHVWKWIDAPLPPSQRRKAVCVVQIAGLVVVVSPIVQAPASIAVAAATLAALTWSFGVDLLWLRRHGA